MKNAVILTLLISTIALGACRREAPYEAYEPLKLGANTQSPQNAR